MEIVLIVLNYNDSETTEKFIKSVNYENLIDKIVVVDNCSTDHSYEVLSEYAGDMIDIIRTDSNRGYAYGNNYGILYAEKMYHPKYIIISNPDIIINEEIIRKMKSFLEQNNERTGLVSGQMICHSEIRTRSAWKLPKYSDCILENLILLKRILNLRKTSYPDAYFEQEYSQVDVVPGSFFMIRLDNMISAGLFDEDTFLYGEENILAFKLKENGYKNYILNDCSYIHNHSVTISKTIKSLSYKLDLAYQGRCIYLNNYLKIGKIKQIINAITYRIGKFNYLILSRKRVKK